MSVEEKQYNVFKIHARQKGQGKDKYLYLVEWEGYPDECDFTWEPHKNLKDCEVYKEFKRKSTKRKREDTGIMVKEIFKKTKRDALTTDERLDIVREQYYKCNLCLNPFGSSTFEVDHIIPLEQGGTNDMVNLQALCCNCHIFKTAVLDRGVIARLLQAKIQNNAMEISRTDILRECQIYYFNRNKHRRPFQEDEMLNFCISTANIYREMCKREMKKRFDIIMRESNLNVEINSIDEEKNTLPPEPDKNKYLNNLVQMIKHLSALNIEKNLITMKTFVLEISFNEVNEINENKLYDELNLFFRKIHENGPNEISITIENILISYKFTGQT